MPLAYLVNYPTTLFNYYQVFRKVIKGFCTGFGSRRSITGDGMVGLT